MLHPRAFRHALAVRPRLARPYATVSAEPQLPSETLEDFTSTSSTPSASTSSTTSAQHSAMSGFAPPVVVADSNSAFAMRTYTPRTPGVRHLKRAVNDHLWKGRPFLPLTFPKKGHGKGGRNCTGRITVRHRGGGHKRRIRTVDFERMTAGPHVVERIEHDPGRTAHIALLNEEATGRKSYIVAAEGMRAGDVLQSYRSGIPKELLQSMGGSVDPGVLAAKTAWRGNCLPLHMIPIGHLVYNIGSKKGRGAVFCRSAGTYGVVVAKDDGSASKGKQKYVTVKLQSGEVRNVDRDACATIGIASNPNYQHEQLGKAGRSRWLNIRPTVRGVAMNACEYPFPRPAARPATLTTSQATIPTVVVEASRRATSTPSAPGARRPRAASRRDGCASRTSGLSRRASATMGSAGPSRGLGSRGCCVYICRGRELVVCTTTI